MNSNYNIKYKLLSEKDLTKELLDHFNRFQEVKNVWRIIDNKKALIEHPFVEQWSSEEKSNLITGHFTEYIKNGGCVFAAFYENHVIAFVSLPYDFFGSSNQYVDLAELYTSFEFRGLGIHPLVCRAHWESCCAQQLSRLLSSGNFGSFIVYSFVGVALRR